MFLAPRTVPPNCHDRPHVTLAHNLHCVTFSKSKLASQKLVNYKNNLSLFQEMFITNSSHKLTSCYYSEKHYKNSALFLKDNILFQS